jgi:sulfur carrier protein ThiS
MMINVKLFGTLSQSVAGYKTLQGLSVELEGGAKVHDVLVLLGAPIESSIVTANGLVCRTNEKIEDGDILYIYSLVHGG